jgi:hypothetical protein
MQKKKKINRNREKEKNAVNRGHYLLPATPKAAHALLLDRVHKTCHPSSDPIGGFINLPHFIMFRFINLSIFKGGKIHNVYNAIEYP